ncbi:MAG: uncharacterized protein A8A55_2477 [Amphiamblys sp. WSBS2006]|nr:MAG: uncharacterized protein A8A55_2477 [Amphiamblys sp. WSBS2006]
MKPSLESLLSNIDEIASEQSLWCRQGKKKRLALSRGTRAILKKRRELKGNAVFNGSLSEEEAAELARTKTDARRKCWEKTKTRQDMERSLGEDLPRRDRVLQEQINFGRARSRRIDAEELDGK